MHLLSADLGCLSQLVELRLAYAREDGGPISSEMAATLRQELPLYFATHLNNDLFAFVAEDQGTLAATAMLLVTRKPPSPKFPTGKVGTVVNVYTLPAYRRQGLARGLMERLLQKAAELNLDFVELKATEDGYPLYRELGFQIGHSPYISMKYPL